MEKAVWQFGDQCYNFGRCDGVLFHFTLHVDQLNPSIEFTKCNRVEHYLMRILERIILTCISSFPLLVAILSRMRGCGQTAFCILHSHFRRFTVKLLVVNWPKMLLSMLRRRSSRRLHVTREGAALAARGQMGLARHRRNGAHAAHSLSLDLERDAKETWGKSDPRAGLCNIAIRTNMQWR